jgi:hypothetical protein
MRHALLIILVLTSVSAAEKPERNHVATYSETIDDVTLSARFPTRNEPGKPILVQVSLQNDSDQKIFYLGSETKPFFLRVFNKAGREVFTAGIGTSSYNPGVAVPPHASVKHEYDISQGMAKAGWYTINVYRPITEANGDWEHFTIKEMIVYVGEPEDPGGSGAWEFRDGR